MSKMSAYDDEVPKLNSSPPDDEEPEEVTRVGTRDEIQRALDDQNGPAANNIPTPPVPAPEAELRASMGAIPGARLAPPPADLSAERPNDTPTKPPVTGVVTESDIEDAFTDTSLEDIEAEELDATLLEVAPPVSSAAPKARSLAPPLPNPRPNQTAPIRLAAVPSEPKPSAEIPTAPRTPSFGTGTLKMQAQPKPVVAEPEENVDESRSRLKRAASAPSMPGLPTPGAPLAPTPRAELLSEPETEAEDAAAPLFRRSPATAALVIAAVIAILIGLFMLRR